MMKRFGKTLLLLCVLTAALAVTSMAADFDSRAQELKNMNLFLGSEQGFDLDRAPTRGEAAVMLVRLLGAETEAKDQAAAGAITNPFTDVPAWANPHISWLYTKGLANGMGDGTFGVTLPCSAQNYCTMVLRALGYSDAAGGDFTYANALTFAQSRGLYDPTFFTGDFLRDDLVAISYQALATDVKGSQDYLLKTLVANGSVDATAAKATTDKIDTYETYLAQCGDWAKETAMDMDMAMKLNMAILGQTVDMDMDAKIQVNLDNSNLQMAMTSTTKAEGETVPMNMWIKDGWLYTEAEGKKVKSKMDMTDLQELINASASYTDAAEKQGLYLLDSITSSKDSAGNTVYTMGYSSALGSIAEAAGEMSGSAAMEGLGDVSVDVGKMTCTVTIDKDNNPIAMGFSFDMKMAITAEGQTVNVTCKCTADITINAVGDKVTVTYPDLSQFVEGTIPAKTAA